MAGPAMTISLPEPVHTGPDEGPLGDLAPLTESDFAVLNRLEDLEAARINFGVVETWTSTVELARRLRQPFETLTLALARLEAPGHVLLAGDARGRRAWGGRGRSCGRRMPGCAAGWRNSRVRCGTSSSASGPTMRGAARISCA